jgi:ATP-dependent helicase/nuclease subunit A
MNGPQTPRAYEIDGAAADAARFTAIACDPARSVVVEACAGSGKTWLLVARILRLLLAGAEPSAILAITFTRKVAQEMRERLLHLLRELALASDPEVCALLRERGMAESDLQRMLPLARGLYERVLRSAQPLSIDTFHSWFARLLQIAPLASGVPQGYALTEATGELQADAYSRFMRSVNDDGNEAVHAALVELYELTTDGTVRRLLDAFLDKRAEWWACGQCGDPLKWLHELCGADADQDARLSLWQDAPLLKRIANIASLLGQGTPTNQKRATAIEQAMTAGASLESFAALASQFIDDGGDPRGNSAGKGKLMNVLLAQLGEDGVAAFKREFCDIGIALRRLQQRSMECKVIALNHALFVAGTAYVDMYQAVKAEQRVFDFADLEWQAYRLLSNEQHAAYLQSRLDARYRHVLLDEFQDTNPLQWSIMRAWFAAYGSDQDKPSVFIVGDPKQSIYRFRRAEPRVFTAARDQLVAQGAVFLRTNQTRRNAQGIVEVINAAFAQNPIFQPQTTLAANEGAVWRLPLARQDAIDKAVWSPAQLRNPLTTPREEEEDERRLQEGRAVAHALWRARAQLGSRSWSDVMLLVKRRTHLRAYERALREAGIPFASDKRGGLLESLEIADLVALLRFLITPNDNLALAHVLKSPIIGAEDEDLITLAQTAGRTWWQRLHASESLFMSAALQRGVALLEHWLRLAPHLPVHDLLDRILHEGDVVARYAGTVSSLTRGQVLGNIEAFTELALSLDAGRYPSLPKFLHQLESLRKADDSDAPDEADVDAAADAVRVLTIHSAKGLEAPIVVLLDANHSDAMREDHGVLCAWSQQDGRPQHFSAFGKQAERGAARDHLFDEEARLKAQEDWNLLYVAATRAKSLLIVSGVAETRGAAEEGIVPGRWYDRLQVAEVVTFEASASQASATAEEDFSLPLFEPAALPIALPETAAAFSNALVDEGIALHALLERLTHGHAVPPALPAVASVAAWLNITHELAHTVHAQAAVILSSPELTRFFDPASYRYARNEMEIVTADGVMRFDRIVMFDDALWILDYKRQLLDSERAAYAAQLARYRAAGGEVFSGLAIRTALITADGRLIEMS